MNQNILDKITPLLQSSNSLVIKESLWTLSNITASKIPHIKLFLSRDTLVERVMTLAKSQNIDTRSEAIWVLANAVNCGSSNEAKELFGVEEGEVVNIIIKYGFKS